MGWHPTTYASHENGSRALTKDAAMRYGAGFGVSWVWLLTGSEDGSVAMPSGLQTKTMPLFGSEDGDRCAAYIATGDISKDARRYTMMDDQEQMPIHSFAFLVEDEDMVTRPPKLGERSFHPGDVVVVSPNIELKPGDFVLCRIHKGPMRLRKMKAALNKDGTSGSILAPQNHDYDETIVEAHKAKIVGRVIRHNQKL
jgi:SOS-response transcriptional repressor LexA